MEQEIKDRITTTTLFAMCPLQSISCQVEMYSFRYVLIAILSTLDAMHSLEFLIIDTTLPALKCANWSLDDMKHYRCDWRQQVDLSDYELWDRARYKHFDR